MPMTDMIRLPYFEVVRNYSVLNFNKFGWHIDKLRIEEIHKIINSGIPVAVHDTGCDVGHMELKNKVSFRYDATGQGFEPMHPHGTHVATIIVGNVNVLGIAPFTKIGDFKVLDKNGYGQSSWIADSIVTASGNGFTIHNLSLGSNSISQEIKQAIDFVTAKGDIVVCASGNDGVHLDYPAGLDTTIAVGAVGYDTNWFVADFSSPAQDFNEINVSAPGVEITSAIPSNSYATWSGTSMATPIVSGIISLLLKCKPSERANVLEILEQTAIDIGEPGQDKKSGFGVVNPLQILSNDAIPPKPVVPNRSCWSRFLAFVERTF